MNNQEEPSALQLINDEENAELMFLLDAFNYQPADRPASRTLEDDKIVAKQLWFDEIFQRK